MSATVEQAAPQTAPELAERPSPDNPNPLTATYLWGYDPEAGWFSAEWFDSNGGRATQTSTGWEGDRLVFIGQMTYGGYRFAPADRSVCWSWVG